MSSKPLLAATVLLLAGFGGDALAQNFTATITVDGQTVTRTFQTQDEALTLLRDRGISAIVPNYTSASTVTAEVNLLGVRGTITLPPGATAATVSFPGAGINQTVTGATRTQVQANLRQLFEGTGNTPEERAAAQSFVTALRQAAVQGGALDPVAGHPLSLTGQMVAADYRAATSPIGALPTGVLDREGGWRFSIGAGYASTSSGIENRSISVPVGVSYTFGRNGIEVFADAPLASSDQRGAQYYQGSVGVGVRFPLLRTDTVQWTLVPQFRAGAGGSDNLATGGYMLSGSVTSDLRVNLGAGYSLQIGNMAGYGETRPIEFNGYKVDYELQNQVWRNGVAIGRKLGEVAGRELHGALTFADTRFTGDRFFVPSWQEYGITLTATGRTPLSFSAAYLDGRNDFRGVRFGLNLAF